MPFTATTCRFPEASGLYLGPLALVFGPEIALPKETVQCVFTALSRRHVFPCRAVLGRSDSRLPFMNPCCLPRALIMSGRLRSVGLMGTRRLGCLAMESVWWVEAHIGSESHSRAVKYLSRASARSPLSSLVPSLIFLLTCFESLVPLVVKFPCHPPGTCHHLPFSLRLVSQPFTDLCS